MSNFRAIKMRVTKKKLSYGRYELLRDGKRVALVEKIVDTGEPIWEMEVLDGTNTDRPNGLPRRLDRFVALSDAQKLYEYCAKRAERQ